MAHRLRVVQLFNGGRGGNRAPRQTIEFNPQLTEAGFELISIQPYRWPLNPLARMHNAYRGLDPLRSLGVLIRERKADLICAHLESAVVILLLRRIFGFRVPVLIWEVPWSPGWRYREVISRLAIPRADHCVVFSSNQLDLLYDTFGHNVAATCVPFCVDTDFFQPQPLPDRNSRYVWSCGLDVGRDFEVLLEASKGVNANFRIKASRKLGLAPDAFPNVSEEDGFLPAELFRERYAKASVVVVSTKRTPNASGVTSLMESLAMGRPTIVSDNPALKDYLPPEGAGIVVPVGDAAALKKAILFLLDNPNVAEEMGRKARLFAEERLSRERHYSDMADVFTRTIQEQARRKGKD